MPVYLSFLTATLFFVIISGGRFTWVAGTAVGSLSSYAMLAIPLFMLAGNLMEIGGIAAKLVDFCSALLSRVKGGMGAVIPVASMLFGTLSGSGTATCAVLSGLLVPRMERLGWDRRYTAALLAASGPLGYMIPPNMNAIMYAVVGNASVAALFLATVVPGLLWGLGYIVLNFFMYKQWWHEPTEEELRKLDERQAEQSMTSATISSDKFEVYQLTGNYLGDLGRTFVAAIPAFIMPLIVLGGIYSGIFTATEAGGIGALYAILVGYFIYKGFDMKGLYNTFKVTSRTMGSILIILPMATLFSRVLLVNGVPQALADAMATIGSAVAIKLLIDLIFFISGFFLNPSILIFVLTPLLMPTAMSVGINEIQLGVILFVGIGIGTVTPPMAMDLFVTSKCSGVPIPDMIKPLMPMLILVCLPILMLVTFVPELSLWLPRLVMG
jgi:C4-dicarboxylate transporter DctM subunit